MGESAVKAENLPNRMALISKCRGSSCRKERPSIVRSRAVFNASLCNPMSAAERVECFLQASANARENRRIAQRIT